MGVHGLWNLLEPVGKPVPLETLENKVLAVDVSIWLHQATKGFRDAQGNPLPNAHLLGLCHRLCKLLFFKIKPVFVFDGGVPILKRQTMAARHNRRDTAVKNNDLVAEKILSNYIKSEVINKQLGKNKGKSGAPLLKKKKLEPDLFELPPIPNQNTEEVSSESDFEDDSNGNLDSISLHMKGHNIHSVDVTSEAFLALPTEIQHEILLELRDTRKQSSWNRIDQMPQEADDFSGFQMERLLKRRNLQQRLNEVVKEIGQKNHEQFALNQGDVAESHKIASDNSTHYVLIKKALQHSTSPTKIGPKKSTNPNVIGQSIKVASVSENLATEKILEVDEDGFSQQELFAIFGSEQKKEPVMCISSSDEDSDFEEVPSALPYPGNRVILDIPINPAIAEEDDMFADIFTSAVPSQTEKPTHQSDDLSSIETDSSTEEPDVLVVMPVDNTTSCKATESTIAISKETVLSSTNISTNLEKENILILSEKTQVTHGANLQLSDENYLPVCLTPIIEQPHSLSEVIDVMVQRPTLENSAFIKEHVSSIARISTEPPPIVQCENLSQAALGNTIEETSKMIDTHQRHDVEGSFEVRNAEITGENSRSQVAFEISPKTTKLTEPPKPPIVHTITTKRKEELEEMGRVINEEQSILIQEHGRQERLASSITDQMYSESQELLRLFGIPYLVAPMEAEAQCAFLDEAGLTQGTITDDSDIWLFGGRRVYKNFFNQGKFVEFFEADDIYNVFKLGREKLVHLALLTGSDYTEGIQGVGPVCALEILAEFPNPGLEALEEFSDWLHKVQAKRNAPPENKIRQKIRNLQVKPGFPNRAVVDAYHNPEINASRSKFSWTDPDLDALRDFLHEKIGWNRDKFNSVVTPVLERFKDKQCQTRIDTYFSVKFPPKMATIVSKRVMNALRKADFGGDDTEIENTIKTSSNSKAPTGKEQRSQQLARSKKNLKTTKVSDEPKASTSGDSSKAPEIIWQKENDKQKLVANKLKAIELFKKSRGRGKRLSRQPRPASSRAQLSESDSN